MFTPLTSSSSSLPFPSYIDAQDPAKFIARAHQELSMRYLQERLLAAPPLIGGTHGPILSSPIPPPPPPPPHFFGRDHFSLVSPFLTGSIAPLVTTSALVPNPYPASTKLSSLQGQKHLTSLFPVGSSSNFSSYLTGQISGHHQIAILQPTPPPPPPPSLNSKDLLGAFHTKTFSSVGLNPFFAPLNQLLTNSQKKESIYRKPSRWSIAHVRIAWEIHLDQQRKMQSSSTQKDEQKEDHQSSGVRPKMGVDGHQQSKKRKHSKTEVPDLHQQRSTSTSTSTSTADVCEDFTPDKRKYLCQDQSQASSAFHSAENHHPAQAAVKAKSDPGDGRPFSPRPPPALPVPDSPGPIRRNSSNPTVRISSGEGKAGSEETLINLLRANDVYSSMPGVVPSTLSGGVALFHQTRPQFHSDI